MPTPANTACAPAKDATECLTSVATLTVPRGFAPCHVATWSKHAPHDSPTQATVCPVESLAVDRRLPFSQGGGDGDSGHSVLVMALGAMIASTAALQIQTRNRLEALSDRLADTDVRLSERIASVEARLSRVEGRLSGVESEVSLLRKDFDVHLRPSQPS